jgi:hypothetical protein
MQYNIRSNLQALLLTESMRPALQRLHPEHDFVVGGRGCDISWAPPEAGFDVDRRVTPGWFYVAGVPLSPQGRIHRSYNLWHEQVPPLVVLDFARGSAPTEPEHTTATDTFRLHEQQVQARYYGVYYMEDASLDIYRLDEDAYRPLPPNAQGRYPMDEIGLELGHWQGYYHNMKFSWLRWWEVGGDMQLTDDEQAALERQLVEQEQWRTERLAALLRSLSSDIEQEE